MTKKEEVLTKPVTVKKMVEKYLKENKYDGLFNADNCGCEVGDLMVCQSEGIENCECGYKYICKNCSNDIKDNCEFYDSDSKWCIGSKR